MQRESDNYLDSFLSVIRSLPLSSSVIFNCGMGVVRTTFAMTSGLLIRRRQAVLLDGRDPFALQSESTSKQFLKLNESKNRDRSLLRLMHVVQKSATLTHASVLVHPD
jgi:Inositol hexakisphosphate